MRMYTGEKAVRVRGIALGLLLVGLPACGDDPALTISQPWHTKYWITADLKRFDSAPTSATSPERVVEWSLTIQVNGQMWRDGEPIHTLDAESRRWLTERDTADFRSRYLTSLVPGAVMMERLMQANSPLTFPLSVATVAIHHYEERQGADEIVDPQQSLPAAGLVLMSEIGANPALNEFFGRLGDISASLK